MYKKSILSVAIASSLMLSGCLENNKVNDENEGDQTSTPVTSTSGSAYPAFNPAVSDLPIPNDLIFDSVASDGTFLVPDSSPPVTTALNQLSGASTVAPIDIKILSGEVDEGTLTGNVHLIELDYASGSALQGLSLGEPPTVTGLANVALEHLVLDGNSYIRINPTEPLNPLTRYIVVVTNGVTDTLGQPLIKNPGPASYAALSDLSIPLANPALEPIQTLINSLWEPTAMATLGMADDSNIVLSYSFTTSGDEKVLNYIADPAQWFNDQLTTFVGVNTAEFVIGQGGPTYAIIDAAVTAQLAAFPSAAIQTALDGAGLTLAAVQSVPGCGTVTAGPAYISCLSAILGSTTVGIGPFAALLPTPASTTITFDETSALDINAVSSLTGSLGIPAGLVSVVQGEMTIPYYAGVPAGANGAPLITDSWEANDTLATAINSAFASLGLVIPHADPTVTTAVNYIFPFPKKKDDVTIPVLGIHPTNPAGEMASVIYQHGITTDRSAALAFGASMVAGAKGEGTDIGIIAIDQPLHGIDGISESEQIDLAETLLTSGQLGGLPAELAPNDTNNQAIVDGVLATSFVTVSLNGAGIIDTSDGLNATEDTLIAGAFDNTLATNVVIGQLQAASVIDITDGISAGEQALIDSAFDGTLASDVVTGQLQAFNIIDITDGIDAGEQATIDAVVAGTSGNVALAALEAAAASLTALELAATTTLPSLQTAAQVLALMQSTVANGSSTIPGLATVNSSAGLVDGVVSERHFGFTSAGAGVAPNVMDYTGASAANRSGSMFINLTSFLTSRDNVRQQVLDLLTVRKSLGTIDVNGVGANGEMSDSDVYFVGHSLGTINGLPFVAVANDSSTATDNIVAANMLTPGSGITRLLENSPAFSGPILSGLAGLGLTQDTSSFQAYMNILQATLDSGDPANFVQDFGPDNLNTRVLFSLVADDQTISNSVDSSTEVLGDGSIAYLSGSEPLVDLLSATQLTTAVTTPLGQLSVRYKSEDRKVIHGTPVFPSSGTAEESAAFAEMVAQATSMVTSGGASIEVTNTAVLEDL